MKKLLLLLLLYSASLSYCQNSNFTILCIAAHPDDEDGATLAYYSKLMGYTAYTVFYTRGEGGQNEIGPELYDELGRIREQECYDAAAIQGSTAYFLGELDFGFSKTAKETFRFWGGEDSVLARIVYVIRVLRPDVIISNHDTITTKPNRQHGHHQVSGITVYDAFDKAADPNYHPEHFVNGISSWQVKKLFFRTSDTTKTDVYEIDISKTDASGRTIRDIAFDALSQHKTQGMDKTDRNSRFYSKNKLYELVRSDMMYPVEGDDLFSGLTPVDKPKPDVELNSYSTYYTYHKISPEDSLRILKSVKHHLFFQTIGLIKSYDNTIENVLKAFDIPYHLLDSTDLASLNLHYRGSYSTIILDLRTYLYRTDVVKYNNKLLEFVKHGGDLVLFYNKPQDWNDKENLAPYPIYITSERVTEENAEVKVLKPKHVFFNYPNKIKKKDWTGWIQERNIYLPSEDKLKTSSEYEKLLSMNDESENNPPTSLLFAKYGLGTYTYCSLALYRQLKIFHEGALKLFFNMISYIDPDKESNAKIIGW